jgi:hypothetical protein
MVLYNITLSVDEAIHEEWLSWMQDVHIPDVMDTGCFTENRICRILGHDEEGGVSFSVQYLCPDMETYDRYQRDFAPVLQKDHSDRYGGRFAAFRTVLDVIHHVKK